MTQTDHVTPRVTRVDALTGRELDAWHALRASAPLFDSPYFHPGFAQAVHESGREVQVAIGDRPDGSIAWVFPHHRAGSSMQPVGWAGADFQGPIVAPTEAIDPLALLCGGARSLEFDHLVDGLPGFDRWISARSASPLIDVSGGLEGYLGRASRSGKDNMAQARRRAAKAEREIGAVTFCADVRDPAVLDEVIRLKRAQYAATGARDYFAAPDRVALVRLLLERRDRSFGGLLSTVHAGDELLAAHFGLRADHVLHWWFPVYEPGLASLGPGWILLRELVGASPGLGIERIDLGRGDDEYKRRAKTGETTVARALVTDSSVRLGVRRAKDLSVSVAKASPVVPALHRALRQRRRAAR